jgi:hypothetical protein
VDTDLLILMALAVVAIWFRSDLIRYIDSVGQMSQPERERKLFGKTLRPETPIIFYGFIGNSSKRVLLFIVFTLAVILIAKHFGVIG